MCSEIEEEIKRFGSTRKEEATRFMRFLEPNRYIIIEGIHNVGKTYFMRMMTKWLREKQHHVTVYIAFNAFNDLEKAFNYVLKKLNEAVTRKLNRPTPVIYNREYETFAEIIKNINEIFNNAKDLKAFIFIDDIDNMTEDDKRKLDNAVNYFPTDFYITFSSTACCTYSPSNCNYLRIKCFNKDKTTEAFSYKYKNPLEDFHIKYRGNPGFIKIAIDDDGLGHDLLPESVKKEFNEVEIEINAFLNQNSTLDKELYRTALPCLFGIFLICEEKVIEFKGVKLDGYHIANLLSKIQNIQYEEKILLDIFNFLKCDIKFCKYYDYEREECVKLYPCLVEWLFFKSLFIKGGLQGREPEKLKSEIESKIREYTAVVCCNCAE